MKLFDIRTFVVDDVMIRYAGGMNVATYRIINATMDSNKMNIEGLEIINNISGNIYMTRKQPSKVELPVSKPSSNFQRKELTLADKVEFIKFYEAAGGSLSIRAAALKFNIGKTAGFGILKRKEEYLKHYALNVDSNRRRMRRSSKFHEINLCTWKWFSSARLRHLNVSGPKLQEKALKFATKLGIESFKASNGWLESFKKCYNIHQQQMSKNNQNEMDFAAKEDWKSKLPTLIGDQLSENVFTCKVTPLYFRASPHRGICHFMEDSNSSSSISAEKLSVILCCSIHGEKLTPWVFGSYANCPSVSTANIVLRSSENGEVTRDAFVNYLHQLNNQLQQKSRRITLFLDPYFNELPELSNVNIFYFPINAVTKCHPIDMGILQFFKAHYRKQLLCTVLPYVDALTNCGELVEYYNCVTVTDALSWINQAWDAVSHNLIIKSYGEARFSMPHYVGSSGSAELLYCELSGFLNLLAKAVNADVVSVNDYIELDNNNNQSCDNPTEDELEDQIAMEVMAERNASPEELLSLNLETDEEELHYTEMDKFSNSPESDMSHKEALESINKLRNFAKHKENGLLPLLDELKNMMENLLVEKSKTNAN